MKSIATWVYGMNATLLLAHEIDAAYWHEWSLFRLPGGIQLFVALHLLIIPAILYGFWQVVLWDRRAELASCLLAGAGILTFAIHVSFLGMGAAEFRLPVSLALIAGTLVTSLVQLALVARIRSSANRANESS